MSSIVTEQGLLHYESVGRGRPLILLHGWINSWGVWREAMLTLSRRPGYRVYALDFWGFGNSARPAGNNFGVASYAELVHHFMHALGIQQAPIIGHSMGGTVAMQLALTRPGRVERLAVVGAPVNGCSLHPCLKLAGVDWIARLVWRYPILLRGVMRLLLARDSAEVRAMIFRDVKHASLESFLHSIRDLRLTSLSGRLAELQPPLMGIYGQRDNIVSPDNAYLLQQHVRRARTVVLARSRHFPMHDEPEAFLAALSDFLVQPCAA